MKKVNLNLDDIQVNNFMLISIFRNQALKQNWAKEEIETVLKEAKSSDYNHVLEVIKKYCIKP